MDCTVGKVYKVANPDADDTTFSFKDDLNETNNAYKDRFIPASLEDLEAFFLEKDKNLLLKIEEIQTERKKNAEEYQKIKKDYTPTLGSRWKYVGSYLTYKDEYIIGRGAQDLYVLINLRTGERYQNGTTMVDEVFRNDEKNFIRIS